MIILMDLDNTIANIDHRLPMLNEDVIDWDGFEQACVRDKPIEPTIDLMSALKAYGFQVWVWTGRSDGVRSETEAWLAANSVPYDQLLMRPHGSNYTTTLLKRRWLDNSPIPRRKVWCAYDDDPSIITMLLKEGIMCYRVQRPEVENV